MTTTAVPQQTATQTAERARRDMEEIFAIDVTPETLQLFVTASLLLAAEAATAGAKAAQDPRGTSAAKAATNVAAARCTTALHLSEQIERVAELTHQGEALRLNHYTLDHLRRETARKVDEHDDDHALWVDIASALNVDLGNL